MIKKPSNKINVFDDSVAANDDFFQGAHNTDTFPVDPLLTGFAFIKWVHVPSWVEQEYGQFKALTEKNLRAVDLPGDIELTTTGITQGFTNNETMVVNGVTKNQGFSMTHREWSGSPVRNMYSLWASGIRDPETGIATYPKEYGVPYGSKNHTGELLYIMTRPDADNSEDAKAIEFAVYFTNVQPLRVPLAHMNYQAGSQEPQELQITFTGNMHLSPAVDDFAVSVFNGQQLYSFQQESDFTSQRFS